MRGSHRKDRKFGTPMMCLKAEPKVVNSMRSKSNFQLSKASPTEQWRTGIEAELKARGWTSRTTVESSRQRSHRATDTEGIVFEKARKLIARPN